MPDTVIGIETEKRIWCDPCPQRSCPLYRRTGVKGGVEKYTCFLNLGSEAYKWTISKS